MNNLYPNRQFVSIDITSDYNLYFHSWPKLFDTIGLIFFIISYAGFIINRLIIQWTKLPSAILIIIVN